MSYPRKVSDEQLMESYARTQSVWKTGKELGIVGQSVHERLQKLNVVNRLNVFTDADKQILLTEYETHASEGRLDELAQLLRRTKQFICRQAKYLGLTEPKRRKPYLAESTSLNMKQWHATHEHPRGMKGKKHGTYARNRVSAAAAERWANMSQEEKHQRDRKSAITRGNKSNKNIRRTWKSAWRSIAGTSYFFRSRWEYNYALYLQHLKDTGKIREWKHEPKRFVFDDMMSHVKSYLPDFEIECNSRKTVYREVKGWRDT